VIAMQSVAAYYVLVALNVANQASHEARVPSPTLARRPRLAALLAMVRRPTRRTAAAAA
jgi:hypothetical protein